MVRVMAAVGMMEDGVCFAGLAMTVSSGLALTRPIVTARPQAEAKQNCTRHRMCLTDAGRRVE